MTASQKQAYIDGLVSGRFTNNAQKIYNLIKVRDYTTEEIYFALFKQRNELSGRITDLLDLGLIKEVKSGKYTTLTLSKPNEVSMLSNTRLHQKVEKWVKAGKKLGIKFRYQL